MVNINKLLLSQQDNERIQLLVFLKENPNSSLYNFFLAQNLPYNKVLYLYHKLIADLRDLSDDSDLTIAELLEEFNFDQYRHTVFKRQIGYQLIMSLLMMTDASIQDFLTRFDISRTKLYRVTTELRKAIAHYGIVLNLAEFRLDGNETLIQSFLLSFLNETGTKIDEFLNDQWASLVARLTMDYLTPTQGFEQVIMPQRKRLVGLALLRLSQGYRYGQLNQFADGFDVSFSQGGTTALLNFFQLNYKMKPNEALGQLNVLEFFLKYSPNFIIDLSSLEKGRVLKILRRSSNWKWIWSHIDPATPVALQDKMELRVIGFINVLMYFGNFPIARDSLMNGLIDNGQVNVTQTAQLAEKMPVMLQELEFPQASPTQIRLLTVFTGMLINLLEQASYKTKIYIADDTYDASVEAFSYMFRGVVEVHTLNDYKSGESEAILMYNEKTVKVTELLSQDKRLVGLHWGHQLPASENYSRLLLLINKYRFSFFDDL